MQSKKSKYLLGCALVATSLGVSGCHHENPLLTTPLEETASFLYQAQQAAAEKTHFYDASNQTYDICVTNPAHYDNPFDVKEKNPCDGLFKAMVAYAKTAKTKRVFTEITLRDLKDPAVVKRLHDALFAEASTSGQRAHLSTYSSREK